MRESYSRAATSCFLCACWCSPSLLGGSLNLGIDLSLAVATTQTNNFVLQWSCELVFVNENGNRLQLSSGFSVASIFTCQLEAELRKQILGEQMITELVMHFGSQRVGGWEAS